MNQYEQFTVLVSKEAQPRIREKTDWAEVRHRFENSNKPILALGFISLLGGFFYLMWANFSSPPEPTLSVKILVWALLSFGTLYLSMKNCKQFERNEMESLNAISADDIKAAVALTGLNVKTTKDLFQLLELGEIALFHNIRTHTLATLRPYREKDVKQVNRFFDTIQYCVENNQKTGPDDVKFPIGINGRSYPEISGAYVNKLMGRKYKSANLYLDWLSD